MACSQVGEDRNVRTVLDDAESMEGRPTQVHPSLQRTSQLVGQVHRVGSGNDSDLALRDWTESKSGADRTSNTAKERSRDHVLCAT